MLIFFWVNPPPPPPLPRLLTVHCEVSKTLLVQRGDISFYLALKAPSEFIEPAEERKFTAEAFETLPEVELEAFETLPEIELNRKPLQFFQFILSLWAFIFYQKLSDQFWSMLVMWI